MSSTKDPDAQFSTFKHHIKSRTMSKMLFTIKDPYGGSSIEASFFVTLECTVTKTLKAGSHW